ncbi:MAG: signal peptidase I [Bacteroidales bacterium]
MTTENNETTITRGVKRKPTRTQWIKCVIASVLYIAWVIWVGNPFLLILLPVIIDIYYTKFIPWTFWKKSENKSFRKVMEWVDAILFALIAVYFINTFFFQNYQIPTSSLEKSLLVGDYLFVSKMSYGPRVPNTPLSFPLAQHTLPIVNTKSYIDWPQWGYKRLKGFGDVERYNIVVFNFPAGDTVALKIQNPDYYTLAYFNGGAEAIKRNPALYGDVVYRPVDRRENYVKRCVGMPGDTLQIIDNQVYIDGKELPNPKQMQLNYYVETNGTRFGEKNWEDLGISKDDRGTEDGSYRVNIGGQQMSILEYIGFTPKANGTFNPIYHMPLTQEALAKVKAMPIVTKVIVEPGFMGGGSVTYPLGYNENWTRSNYGPIWIPKKGATIELNPDNVALYERCIRNYEDNKFEVKGGKYFINGQEATSYTFLMDYYWMMGDNRDNSADSRSWGFVPEDHVVGRPLFVWLSIDKDKGLFNGGIRFNRLFMNAKNL